MEMIETPESSQVAAHGHNPDTNTLAIKYKSGGVITILVSMQINTQI